LVPTSAITIDWASSQGPAETKIIGKERPEVGQSAKITEFFKFSQLRVTSKDGFQLDVDVRLIIRIPPPNAPFVIARFGTVSNLIEQVAHPLIDSSFRNEAGKKAAMEFVHSRTELQLQALEKAREEFSKYHVEVQGLLIAYISVDTQLLETQTKKEIAVQQQKQYEQEALAQEQRIAVAEKTARANQQENVIAAKLSIEIAAAAGMAHTRHADDGDAMLAQGAVPFRRGEDAPAPWHQQPPNLRRIVRPPQVIDMCGGEKTWVAAEDAAQRDHVDWCFHPFAQVGDGADAHLRRAAVADDVDRHVALWVVVIAQECV
jgi:hypothetical protein